MCERVCLCVCLSVYLCLSVARVVLKWLHLADRNSFCLFPPSPVFLGSDGDANAKRERRLSIGGAGAFGGDASAASPRVAFDLGDTETLSDDGLATPFADVAATRVFGDEGEASEAESPVAPGGRPIPASAIPAVTAFPPARAVEMDDERREHLAREQKIATAAGLLSGWINTRLAHVRNAGGRSVATLLRCECLALSLF